MERAKNFTNSDDSMSQKEARRRAFVTIYFEEHIFFINCVIYKEIAQETTTSNLYYIIHIHNNAINELIQDFNFSLIIGIYTKLAFNLISS